MLKWVRFTVLILMIFIVGAAAIAQDTPAEVPLIPIDNPAFGLTASVPDGWRSAGPGLYARGSSATDFTLIAVQSAPLAAQPLLEALLPQLGLSEAPESVGTFEGQTLTYTLYAPEIDVRGTAVAVRLGLAETEGRTYLVLLQTTPEEVEALNESVFVPVMDSVAPLVEVAEEVPYAFEEVMFLNGDVSLAGTLTLPDLEGPHPAVVLVSGSGPQDRNQSLAPISMLEPFEKIADAFTRAGIAVLRYDDRGVGSSTGDFSSATSFDFATDAGAAVDYLKTRSEIDPDQIGILGHSEGAMIAMILGAERDDLAYLIFMGGPAVKGRDVLIEQNALILTADGGTPEMVDLQVEYITALADTLESGDVDAVDALVEEYGRQQFAMLTESQQAAYGDVDSYIELVKRAIESYKTAWFPSFLAFDPAEYIPQISAPVLAVFGELDLQVSLEQNAAPMEALLAESQSDDVTIITIEGANHLFQRAVTGSPSEYAALESEFTPDFLPTLTDWLLARVTLAE